MALKLGTLALIGGGVGLLVLATQGGGAKASSSTSSTGGAPVTVQGLAQQLASDIQQRGYDYNRALCLKFQLAAGLTGKDADGIYGPQTRTNPF